MKNNDYLIAFCTHINSPYKKSIVEDSLKKLNEEKLDVCISTHSNQYLGDISKLAKFTYYDYNNEYITVEDYVKYADYIDVKNCKGGTTFWFANGNGYTERLVDPPYSKPALSLLKNAIFVAKCNHYKWLVYFEYDIPIPEDGLKNLIDKKIVELEEKSKECFIYTANFYGTELIYPGMIIFKTDTLFNHDIILNNKWNLNKTDWIKSWGNSGFEHTLESCIKEVYDKSGIISERIYQDSITFWKEDNPQNLSRSSNSPVEFKDIVAYLYPYKNNKEEIELYFLAYNPGLISNSIESVSIYYDENIVYSLQECILHNHLDNFEILLPSPKYTKNIKLIYTKNGDNKMCFECTTQNLQKIHDYIIRYTRHTK